MAVLGRRFLCLRCAITAACALGASCAGVPEGLFPNGDGDGSQAAVVDGPGGLDDDLLNDQAGDDPSAEPDVTTDPPVEETPTPLPGAPIANAGTDVAVDELEQIVLDGSASIDLDLSPLTYLWQQSAGLPVVAISRPQSVRATFVAPDVDGDQVLEFTLTVNNGQFSASDSVRIGVLDDDLSIVVNAGADQSVVAGSPVTLRGVVDSSSDAPIALHWSQIEGPSVALSDEDAAETVFQVPASANSQVRFTFELSASIGNVSASDQMQVAVLGSAVNPPSGCTTQVQCDDGLFCNGAETCVGGACASGANPCPTSSCNEQTNACVACVTNGDCANGPFCDGVETCTNGACHAGVAPCSGLLCNEATDACVQCLTNAHCTDGLYCNGTEACVNGTCQSGVAPCSGLFCNETTDACVQCLTNANCIDGLFCNGSETCAGGTCQAGAVPCNGSYCSEATDTCVQCLTNGHCSDGLFCNGSETCVNGACQSGSPPCGGASCIESSDTCTTLVCNGQTPPFGAAQQAGTLLGSVADEASGLVASRKNSDVLWTHNDDTGDNRVFAIHVNGTLLGTYTLGSGSVDPEDIAIGPGPLAGVDYIYWGSIGDNNNVRSTIFVKRVAEPTIASSQSPPLNVSLSGVDTLTFAYPTGANAPSHKDSETLLVDPLNGDIYVVTKRTAVGMVYRAAYPQSTSGVTTLQYVASIDWGGAVGGDVSPDGQLIIIRRYSGNSPAASIWTRPGAGNLWDAFAQPRCDVALASEPQGEAICWDRLGQGYYTVSENQTPGAQIPIWYFPRN